MDNKRGYASVVILFILLVGLLVAIAIVGIRTSFKEKAAEPMVTTTSASPWGNSVVFKTGDSAVLSTNAGPHPTPFYPPSSYTIELWVKPDPLGNQNTEITYDLVNLKNFDATYPYTYNLHLWHASFYPQDTFNARFQWTWLDPTGKLNSGYITTGASTFLANTWTHLATTVKYYYPYCELWIFVNGKRTGGGVYTGTNGACLPYAREHDRLSVGGRITSEIQPSTTRFVGNIEELAIWKNLKYTSDFTLPTRPYNANVDTVSLWHFDNTVCESNVVCKFPDEKTGSIYGLENASLFQLVPSTVPAPNNPPVADFTHYIQSIKGNRATVGFLDKSTDPDGINDIVSYFWDFGNGQTSTLKDPLASYVKSGNQRSFTVTHTVKDGYGASSTATKTIQVF